MSRYMSIQKKMVNNNMIKDMGCLSLCLLGNFSCIFVVCWFFQNQFSRKILSGILSECQIVWIQVRPDKMSGLIWVQTVCIGLSADDTRRQRLIIIILGCLWVNRLFISCLTVHVFRVRINQGTRYTHAATALGWASAKFMSSLHNFIALS